MEYDYLNTYEDEVKKNGITEWILNSEKKWLEDCRKKRSSK